MERCRKHDVNRHDGECPVCRSFLLAADQNWVGPWQEGELDEQVFRDCRNWILSLAPAVREVAYEFPPNCLIKTRPGRDFFIPMKGTVGVAIGYREPIVWQIGGGASESGGQNPVEGGGSRDLKEITVLVVQSPASMGDLRSEVSLGDIEIVGYWKNLTAEKLRGLCLS